MYLIKSGENIIYDSRDKDTYPVIKPSLEEGLNEAGTLTFTVLPGHPHYDKIKKMQTFVTAYRDDNEIFFGRVLITDRMIDGQMEVTCEGGLTFLLDSELDKGEYHEKIDEFFIRCIVGHNQQVEAAKQLWVGDITLLKAQETTEYDFDVSQYTNTKSAIETMLTGRFGGYIRIRLGDGGKHYIDYLEDYGRVNTQPVQIGHNIIDKNDHVSGEDIFTILRPIGKRQPSGTSESEDTDVTIATMSQSDITLPNVTKNGMLLELTDKITLYGRIVRTEQFGSAETPAELLKMAEEYIERRGTQLPSTCDINLVDFYHLNSSVMDVRLGDVFNNIEGFTNETMTVGQISIDMEDPANDTITLKNSEEINSGRQDYNVTSSRSTSSSSLTSSSAKSSGYSAERYKYYQEGIDEAKIATKVVEINASERFSVLGSKVYLTVEDLDPDNPGELVLKAVTKVDDPNGTQLVMNVDGLHIVKKTGYQQDGTIALDGSAVTVDFGVGEDSLSSVITKTGVNELGQSETLYSKITQTESKYERVVGRVDGHESRLRQTEDEIELKADKVTLNALRTTVNNLLSGSLTADHLRATNATLGDSHGGRVYLLGQQVRSYQVVGTDGNNHWCFGYSL